MPATDRTYANWSGGKDSALALYHAIAQKQYIPDLLLTSVNATYQRISMHGVRTALLERQAAHIGLPLRKLELPEGLDMPAYNAIMSSAVQQLCDEGYRHTIFGDIFLADLRAYREEQLRPLGIGAHFPLWQRDTRELLYEFLDLGFKTIVVCVNAGLLDRSFAGRTIDRDFIRDLPKNVDPCGENGEFHTFVFDGPVFKKPVDFTIGETVYREYPAPKSDIDSSAPSSQMGFWFCDLVDTI